LRKVAAGATRLELLVDPDVMKFEREEAAAGDRKPRSGVLASVSDRAAIAELLAAIDTPPVPFGVSGGHGCGGFPIVRLFRGDTLAAEFSFDHVAFLRPRSPNLWRGGDVEVTGASAKAMADWFKRHGYSGYQDELDSARREQERWDAFYSAFPKQVRKFLKDYRVRYVETSSGLDRIPAADALAAAIPNEHKRAEVICRALGLLDRNWFGATDAESAVLGWAEALSPQTLIRAIDGFADNSPELLGAALCSSGRSHQTGRG
jgi:hypothetical protein